MSSVRLELSQHDQCQCPSHKDLFFFNYASFSSDKTPLLLVGTKSTLSTANSFSLTTDSATVSASLQLKSLGVILHSSLSFHSHISNIAHSAYFHWGNINGVGPSLTPHSTAVLVHSLITSHSDLLELFSNSLVPLTNPSTTPTGQELYSVFSF